MSWILSWMISIMTYVMNDVMNDVMTYVMSDVMNGVMNCIMNHHICLESWFSTLMESMSHFLHLFITVILLIKISWFWIFRANFYIHRQIHSCQLWKSFEAFRNVWEHWHYMINTIDNHKICLPVWQITCVVIGLGLHLSN